MTQTITTIKQASNDPGAPNDEVLITPTPRPKKNEPHARTARKSPAALLPPSQRCNRRAQFVGTAHHGVVVVSILCSTKCPKLSSTTPPLIPVACTPPPPPPAHHRRCRRLHAAAARRRRLTSPARRRRLHTPPPPLSRTSYR